MAKTFSDLQTAVRVYLDETQQTDFLDTEVKASINYAYHAVIMEVMEIYEDFYNTTTPVSISTIANQQEYPLDTTMIKVRRVEINYNPSDANSVAQRAVAIKMAELPQRLSSTNSGGSNLFNAGYYLNGAQSLQKIGFVPVPTTTGTSNVSVWGIQLPVDLVSSSDAVLLPWADNFSYLVALRAAADLLRKGQQEEQAASQYFQNYEAGILKMKTFLKERQSDGVWMIQDGLMEATVFDSPL